MSLDLARFIEVEAEIRYWEDAIVNGQEDINGLLIPCRVWKWWKPLIDLKTGQVINWPVGTEAYINYKVCDVGEYYLLNGCGWRIAKWNDDYVPNDILCVGDNGFGDYIILHIGADGFVVDWKEPCINPEQWDLI